MYLRNLASQTEYAVSVFAVYDGDQSEPLKGVFTTSKGCSLKVHTECDDENNFAVEFPVAFTSGLSSDFPISLLIS